MMKLFNETLHHQKKMKIKRKCLCERISFLKASLLSGFNIIKHFEWQMLGSISSIITGLKRDPKNIQTILLMTTAESLNSCSVFN